MRNAKFPSTVRLLLSLLIAVGALTLNAGQSHASAKQARGTALTNTLSSSTPPFSVRQERGQWWLFSPEQKPFFSLGVCCVEQGFSPATFDPENPGYSAWSHYRTPTEWADASLARLKSWGFTTVGAWSEHATLRQSAGQTLWLTPVLHIGSTAGAPWWDMWDKKNVARMEQVARDQILPVRDDPRLLGYYSDNELGWWNAMLWKMTLEQPSSSGQRRRLVNLLRDTYRNDWQELLADFESRDATGWRQLQRGGTLLLKPSGHGVRVMRQFLGLLANRYYQLMRDIIRKYDQRALFLGDRYQSFYYPEVARAAAPWVDAISSNLNANWSDGTFMRCYLDTLHALTGKPVLVSEFYATAQQNRSGNRNTRGVFPVVTTQLQRADTARRTLDALLGLPYVVGAEWFQFSDEPTHGRYDGENFNFGLVDIQDKPYEELTRVFTSLTPAAAKANPRPSRPDASEGIPQAPEDPFADFQPLHALMHWDRERGFVKPVSEFPLADLYLCWSPQALYLGLYTLEIIEPTYYQGGVTPKQDRTLWTVEINQAKPVQARLGADREPLVNDPSARIENLSGPDMNVRILAIMELPATRFGLGPFKAGDELELSSALLTHLQAYRVEWRGRFRLAQ